MNKEKLLKLKNVKNIKRIRKSLSSRKAIVPDLVTWSILGGAIISLIVFIPTFMKATRDFQHPVGSSAAQSMRLVFNAEHLLMYVDVSGKLSLLQSLYQTAHDGGHDYYSSDGSDAPCGNFAGLPRWNIAGVKCAPDAGVLTDSINGMMSDNVDYYLSRYPDTNIAFSLKNYDFSTKQEGGRLTVTGMAKSNINLAINGMTPLRTVSSDTDLPQSFSSSYIFYPDTFSFKPPKNAKDTVTQIKSIYIDTIRTELDALKTDRNFNSRYLPSESLVVAIISQESKGNPDAVSPTGCAGIAQFCLGTAAQYSEPSACRRAGQKSCNIQSYNQIFSTLTACSCSSTNCRRGTPIYCNRANDDRFDAVKSIQAEIRLLYENKKRYASKGYTDSEKFAIADYNGGALPILNTLSSMGNPSNPAWDSVASSMKPDDISGDKGYYDGLSQAGKASKVNQILGYVRLVSSYQDAYNSLDGDSAAQDNLVAQNSGSGSNSNNQKTTGAVVYDPAAAFSSISGRAATSQPSASSAPKIEDGFGAFAALYSVKPSFTAQADYDLGIYSHVNDVMSKLAEQCKDDITYSCAGKILNDPQYSAEVMLKYSMVNGPSSPGESESKTVPTNYKWLLRHGDDFISQDPGSSDAQYSKKLWKSECESAPEIAVDDFVYFMQNCIYSNTDDCACQYPGSIMSPSGTEYDMIISQDDFAYKESGYTGYSIMVSGNENTKKYFSMPSSNIIPIEAKLKLKDNDRNLVLTFNDSDGNTYLLESKGNPGDVKDRIMLYKKDNITSFTTVGKTTFTKTLKDSRQSASTDSELGADKMIIATSLNAYESAIATPNEQHDNIKNTVDVKTCDSAPVIRACVVDNQRNFLVYDPVTGITARHHPAIRLSYFITPSPPTTTATGAPTDTTTPDTTTPDAANTDGTAQAGIAQPDAQQNAGSPVN